MNYNEVGKYFLNTIRSIRSIGVLAVLASCSPLAQNTDAPIMTPTPIVEPLPTFLPTYTLIPAAPSATPLRHLSPSPPSEEIRINLLPSQVLDLTNWKITLPSGPGQPDEIKQPELATFQHPSWFSVSSDKGVVFRAPISGVTTSGSSYPRSELREMTNGGRDKASWSSSKGTHTIVIDQAITVLPKGKPQLVSGQIHDAKDDVIVIRLEGRRLWVNVDGRNKLELDSNYVLGKRFTVKFVVENGKTYVYYNNSLQPVYAIEKNYEGAYFKAGAYPQSNCNTERPAPCDSSNYGEVVIYQLKVSHNNKNA